MRIFVVIVRMLHISLVSLLKALSNVFIPGLEKGTAQYIFIMHGLMKVIRM